MSSTLNSRISGRVANGPHLSAPFGARAWAALGDVVGESAAASLLQYAVRTATSHVAVRGGRPATVVAALSAAAEGVPFSFEVLTETPSRVELTWEHATLAELPEALRMPYTRGVFLGALAATPAGSGWGVMVLEDPSPMVVLARGIT